AFWSGASTGWQDAAIRTPTNEILPHQLLQAVEVFGCDPRWRLEPPPKAEPERAARRIRPQVPRGTTGRGPGYLVHLGITGRLVVRVNPQIPPPQLQTGRAAGGDCLH